MKTLLIALLFTGISNAATQVQFIPIGRAIVTILGSDAVDLFDLMNVPEQNTMLGPGKGISTNSQDMNFSCGTQTSRGPMCSIVFNSSSRSKVSSTKRTITFKMTGSEAQEMLNLWRINDEFITEDQKMRIKTTSNAFQIEFID